VFILSKINVYLRPRLGALAAVPTGMEVADHGSAAGPAARGPRAGLARLARTDQGLALRLPALHPARLMVSTSARCRANTAARARPSSSCAGMPALIMKHGLASSRQAISQHLTVLEQACLVHTRRQGRYKCHYIDTSPLRSIVERWPIDREEPNP
jgi:DNA-binding transcriptional ArsR family regulator